MLRSSFCDYSDAYVLLKGTITAINTAGRGHPNSGASRKVIFKNCAPFTNCVRRINNDALDIDVLMSMYNLIEYSGNYSKTLAFLWQYCRKEPALADDDKIADFTEEKITGKTKKTNVKIMLPSKCLSNFWRIL